MKKILLMLLGVLMALPALARDFEYPYEGQTLTYTVIDEDAKTCMTKAGNSSNPGNNVSGELIIPEIAKDGDVEYTVTKIGDYSFFECSGLTSVTIPNSVTSIEWFAFAGCSGLTSVIIPGSVTKIGSAAFEGCSGLKKSAYPNTLGNPFYDGLCVRYNPEGAIIEDGWIYGPEKSAIRFAPYSLTGDYVIPESVKKIGDYAFNGCSGLTSVTIPNSVTEIGWSAFNDCSGLTSVTIGNSVKTIGDHAFAGCSGLTSVTIPNSVTEINHDAFLDCSGLTKAEFVSIDQLCSIKFGNNNSNPLYYAHNLYINGKEIKDLVIPESVKKIGDHAFAGCSGLTSVTIPNSVTEIGWSAFYDCSGLTSVTIPNSVTSIGGAAFYECSGLTSVTIGNSVKTIGDWAFGSCDGLASVIIPASVTSIGNNAFDGCSSLEKSAYPNTLSNPFSNGAIIPYDPEVAIIENGWIYGPEKSEIWFAPYTLTGDYVIPESVISIGDGAFCCCHGLTSVTIGNSVKTIGEFAFQHCSGLTSLEIPNSVSTISKYAFRTCI